MIYLGMCGMFGPYAGAPGRLPMMAPFLRAVSPNLWDVLSVAGKCNWKFATARREDGRMMLAILGGGPIPCSWPDSLISSSYAGPGDTTRRKEHWRN